ncbi:MAG: SpoIIE family protein phosphatase [Bacteroidales bacterium]|nr:SpoIIE family protein phosphatase [Bacteroidales bacterium]
MRRGIYILIIAVLAFSGIVVAQPEERLQVLDSLSKVADATQRTDQKLQVLDRICEENFQIDTTMKYAEAMLQIAQRSMDKPMTVRAMRYIADCYYNNSEYERAMDLLTNEAIPMALEEKCWLDLGISYAIFGNCISFTKKGTNGNQWFDKAIEIFRSIHNVERMIWAFNLKSTTYIENGLLDYAQTYIDSSMKYADEIKNDFWYADTHYYQAYLLSYDDESTVAARNKIIDICQKDIEYLKSVYKYEDVIWNSGVMVDLLVMNIQATDDNNEKQQYIERCKHFLREYDKYEEEIGYNIEPINKHKLKFLIASEQYPEALEALKEARAALQDVGKDNFLLDEVYEAYRWYYEETDDYKMALAYADSSGSSSEVELAVGDTKKDYQGQLERQEVKFEADMRTQKIIMWTVVGVLVLLMIFAGYVVRTSLQRREMNRKLASQNEELQQQREELHAQNEALNEKNECIEKQNKEIEEFNEQMRSSLRYAKRIQIAAMPSPDNMKSIFGDFLCMFRPFNIVSGDYMWASQKGKHKLLVVADCTGHGVPGALLSILGISLLNEIVATNDLDTIQPGEILNLMRAALKKTLRQEVKSEEVQKDGMDLALMVFDMEAMKLRYAGAYRPIVRVRKGEVETFDTSKMPIGSHIKDQNSFDSFETDIQAEDCFYAFSDGITDQFGYRDEDNKVSKFTPKRLRALLAEIYYMPFDKQQMIIEKTIDNWKTSKEDKEIVYPQTDDNLIVGIRI